jgi:hypothetical protein
MQHFPSQLSDMFKIPRQTFNLKNVRKEVPSGLLKTKGKSLVKSGSILPTMRNYFLLDFYAMLSAIIRCKST